MAQKASDKTNMFWFLPTHGDDRYLGTTGGCPVDLPYLQQAVLVACSPISCPAARGYFGELIGLPQVADHAASGAAEALQARDIVQFARCPTI